MAGAARPARGTTIVPFDGARRRVCHQHLHRHGRRADRKTRQADRQRARRHNPQAPWSVVCGLLRPARTPGASWPARRRGRGGWARGTGSRIDEVVLESARHGAKSCDARGAVPRLGPPMRRRAGRAAPSAPARTSKVQEGCDRHCTVLHHPRVRAAPSVPARLEALRRAKRSRRRQGRGIAEIVLTGIRLASLWPRTRADAGRRAQGCRRDGCAAHPPWLAGPGRDDSQDANRPPALRRKKFCPPISSFAAKRV